MKNFLLFLILLLFPEIVYADFTAALATYRTNMDTYGDPLCAEQAKQVVSDTHLLGTYYDGQRVFFNLYDYTGNSKWLTCASHDRYHYRDHYVIANNGSVPGYWVFPHGLARDYTVNGQTASLTAIDDLHTNASYCRGTAYELSAIVDNSFQREVAYCLMLFLEERKLGRSTPYLTQYKDAAKGHLKQQFIDHTASSIKPFMVALGSEALIQYQSEVGGDSQILTYVKAAADGLWATFWDIPSQSFFYVDNPIPGDEGHVPAPDLNLLIAPLYGWVYSQTLNSTYKTEGDQVFIGGVNGAYLAGSGKQFNQNYRWSNKYITWRAAVASPTPTPSVSPTATPTPAPTATPTRTPTPIPTATPCSLTVTTSNLNCRVNRLETLVCGHHPC